MNNTRSSVFRLYIRSQGARAVAYWLLPAVMRQSWRRTTEETKSTRRNSPSSWRIATHSRSPKPISAD